MNFILTLVPRGVLATHCLVRISFDACENGLPGGIARIGCSWGAMNVTVGAPATMNLNLLSCWAALCGSLHRVFCFCNDLDEHRDPEGHCYTVCS